MVYSSLVHFANYIEEFKNKPIRVSATVQTKVTMGDITESRPVNVSFSFFYVNSLPISNWIVPPSLVFLSKHKNVRTHMYSQLGAHIHNEWNHGNIWRSSSNAQTNVSWRAAEEASERLPLRTQTHTSCLQK